MLPNPMRKGWNMLKHGTIIEESTQVSFFEGRFRLLTFEQWHHWCFCWQSNFVHLSPRPRDRKGNSNMTTVWSEELRRWLTGEQCGWLWNVHRAVLGETWIRREHVDDLRVSYSHPQITMCNYSTNTTDVSTYILYMYIYICIYICVDIMCMYIQVIFKSPLVGICFVRSFQPIPTAQRFLFVWSIGWHPPNELMAGCKNQREPNPDTMNQIYLQESQEKNKKGKRKNAKFPWPVYLFTCKSSHDFHHRSSFMPASSDSERCFDAGALIRSGGTGSFATDGGGKDRSCSNNESWNNWSSPQEKEDSCQHRNLRVHPHIATPPPPPKKQGPIFRDFY